MTDEREPFGKDKFCRTVTGHTDTELRDMVTSAYVDPVDRAHHSIGRDMPESEGDREISRYLIFMNAQFQVPLLDIPLESLYDAFRRFREWEEYIHPRDQFLNHEGYWGPAYRNLEQAYETRNETGVKAGIVTLVDKIIHD